MNILSCLLASLAITFSSIADTWTVDDDGKADFNNIQAAVDAASDGDEIIVMPGTYTSTQDGHVVNMLGKAVTLRSSDPSDPDVVAATIIDGEDARRGIACFNEETNKTVIDGFTVTNGYSTWYDYDENGDTHWSEQMGGGIYCKYGNPSIKNCTISGNTSDSPSRGGGAGISCYYGSPTITDCIISNNTSSTGWSLTYCGGGGIFCVESSNAIITRCTIIENTSIQVEEGNDCGGGGIYCYDNSSPIISSCTISGNTGKFAGGIFLGGNSGAILENSTISSNTAISNGGGIYFGSNSPLPSMLETDICNNIPSQIAGGTFTDLGGNTITTFCGSNSGACCTNDMCVIAEQGDCVAFYGQWLGEGSTCDEGACPENCFGDITGDGIVNVTDVLAVMAAWGACP